MKYSRTKTPPASVMDHLKIISKGSKRKLLPGHSASKQKCKESTTAIWASHRPLSLQPTPDSKHKPSLHHTQPPNLQAPSYHPEAHSAIFIPHILPSPRSTSYLLPTALQRATTLSSQEPARTRSPSHTEHMHSSSSSSSPAAALPLVRGL